MNQDIVVLVDVSSSLLGQTPKMERGVEAIVSKFDIGYDKVNFGFIEFSTHVVTVLPLSSNKDSIDWYVSTITRMITYGSTSMSYALEHAETELYKSQKFNSSKVIILVTDGIPNSTWRTKEVATRLKGDGIKICSIFIQRSFQSASMTSGYYLYNISSDGCFTVTTFDNIVEDINKLNFCF